jgi:hypothetical protein
MNLTVDPMATWIASMRGQLPQITTEQVMNLTRSAMMPIDPHFSLFGSID